MDEHDVDRTTDDRAGDPAEPVPEPRSYDPFDEDAPRVPTVWDSWSDPPSDYPPSQAHRPVHDLDEPTVGMAVVFDDGETGPDQTGPDETGPDQSDPDHSDRDHSDRDEFAGDATIVVPAVAALSPAPGRGHASVVERDLLIADRFRLEEQLAERAGFLTWQAFDLKLSRPVLVHVLSEQDPHNDDVLAAAREAATATDSAFLRVLDAASSSDDLAYVVCEYVVGKSLEEVLGQGPLSGLEAAWVLREVARAMAPMHALGLYHLRLSPDTVIISSTGNVRIVGFLIDAALTPGPGDLSSSAQKQEVDVHSLGQLLYAMLVSRWPVLPDEQHDPRQRHHGLLPAPMDAHGWLTPRQVRAGVSPALDQICDQILHAEPRLGGSPLTTAAAIDEALAGVLGTADASSDLSQRVRHEVLPVERTDSVPAQAYDNHPRQTGPGAVTALSGVSGLFAAPGTAVPSPGGAVGTGSARARSPRAAEGAAPGRPRPRPPKHRVWLRMLLVLIALVLIGSLVAVGVRNGRVRRDAPASAGPPSLVVHPIAKVDDFDPQADGGNGEESPNAVAKAWDKNPSTAWTTVTYLNNAKLGGLKPGVGLVVDLGQVVEVGTVKLTLQGTPTAVSVMVPQAEVTGTTPPMGSVGEWRTVASSPKAGTTAVIDLKATVATRHLLIHLTSLPNVGGNKYRGAIAEIVVTS